MRCSNPITFWIFPIAVALLLAAVPRDAEAQVCKILKSKRLNIGKKECVVPGDIKNESLTQFQVRDMARSRRFFPTLSSLSASAPGLVIITASVEVDASGSNGPVSVLCTIAPGKTARKNSVKHLIFESLNPAEGVKFASIVATKIYKVRKGRFRPTFSCAQIAGTGATFQNGNLDGRYVPTEY